MLVNVIEDSAIKASQILSFLSDHHKSFRVTVNGSFQSGLRAIEEACPDLIILDMTLPTFDRIPNAREGRFRPLGGYDLMRKMRLRGISTKVIVLTQLEAFGEGDEEIGFIEITERCHREFPGIFMGSIYFSQGSDEWQLNLNEIINKFTAER